MDKPLCQTCNNIFYFPECCTENLADSVKIITYCENYDGNKMEKSEKQEERNQVKND